VSGEPMTTFERILPLIAYERWRVAGLRETLERYTPSISVVISILSVGLLGSVDYLTGNEINFSFFYLAPILLVTWVVHQKWGVVLSLLSALAWLIAESAADVSHHSSASYFWNTLIHIGFFVLLNQLVSQLKETQRKEQLAARTDFVTGTANARYFDELLQMEIERIRRYPHPLTVVYMDIDNFKQVNDLFGHRIGDEMLRWIAGEMRCQLRKTDVIARLGGDEFALLLPSARLKEAKVVISKLRANLMAEMRQRNWPVTFSMGVVVCVAPPLSVEQIIARADGLMYEVKNSTKNGVRYTVWDGKGFANS
jgi:diguanylate cyclase (GGDEF)-like protein